MSIPHNEAIFINIKWCYFHQPAHGLRPALPLGFLKNNTI